MTTGQTNFDEALTRAEAAVRAVTPGFDTLDTGQQRVAVLRRAVLDAGGKPAGPSFPNPADEPRVIIALQSQLRILQSASEVAAPYNQFLFDAAAPDLHLRDHENLLASEAMAQQQGTGRPGAASSAPEHDMRDRAVALQKELLDLGITPVVQGRILPGEAAVAITRLTNQLNAALDPGWAARTAPQEFSSTSDAAAPPVQPSRPAQPPVSEQAAPGGVHPSLLEQVSRLQERIRSAGGHPEFTAPITSANVSGAIVTLQNQAERLLVVNRARRELEESAAPTDVMDPREVRIMALQQAIRDYGEVPEVTGELRRDSYANAILTLDRQLKEIVARPPGFDRLGFNTDPFSTDAQAIGGSNEDRSYPQSLTQPGPAERAWAEEAARRPAPGIDRFSTDAQAIGGSNEDRSYPQSMTQPGPAERTWALEAEREEQKAREREEMEAAWRNELIPDGGLKRAPSNELLDAFNRLKPLFRPGELEPLLARIYLIRDGDAEAFFDEWTPAEQVSAFLDQVIKVFNLSPIQTSTTANFTENNLERLRSIELQQKRNADGLTFRESGANFYMALAEQWIPDSVANSLPTPLRQAVQSMLDYTSPIGALSLVAELLFTGGTATAFSVLGDIAADTTSQLLEERRDSLIAREIKANLVGEGVELTPDILLFFDDLATDEKVMEAIFGIAYSSVDEAGKAAIQNYARRVVERARNSGDSPMKSFVFDLISGGIEAYVHRQAARGPIVQKRVDLEDWALNSNGLFVAAPPFSYLNNTDVGNDLWMYGAFDDSPLPLAMRMADYIGFEVLGTIAATVAGRDDLPEAQRMLASQALGKRLRGEELTGFELETLEVALGESFDDALERARLTVSESKLQR